MERKISAHQKVFEGKPEEERKKLLDVASSIFATPGQNECARTCPACGGQGKLIGVRFKEFSEQYSEGELYMDVDICQLRFNVWYVSYPLDQLKRLRKLDSPLISKKLN